MRIIHSLDEMTETARGWLAGGVVGFVPTAGRLHAGHLALVQAAQRECEITVVSILVNERGIGAGSPAAPAFHVPLSPGELVRDLQLLDAERVHVVFVPGFADIYPPDFSTYVTPFGSIPDQLEGAVSPDRFRGLATTIAKLLHLVRPDIAYFGQRYAQRIALIRRMVQDLAIDVSLRVLPIVRESDGLALSGRNALLSPPERQAAPLLHQALVAGKALIEQGERRREIIEQEMARVLASSPLVRPEYATVCNPDTFQLIDFLPDPTSTPTPTLSLPGTLLVVAAHLGPVRLTDNILRASNGTWLT